MIWIGYYFSMDNDVGEHWFKDWELRKHAKTKLDALVLDETSFKLNYILAIRVRYMQSSPPLV